MVDDRGINSVFLEVIAVISIVLFAGVFLYIDEISEFSIKAINEIDETSKVVDSEMRDKDLSLVLASYPNMIKYTSNQTTRGNPNDYFIETDDGNIHYIEINRYWFRKPDLTTNDSETIKEGTMLYYQYEESLAIIEDLE